MNVFNIERAFDTKEERKWNTLWWMIDVHDTIFKGKYATDQDFEFYPGCLEVLKWISNQPDQEIILWTSSFKNDAERVIKYFKEKHDITINYFNENPACPNTDLADFSAKPYFNILIDDKAGFEGEVDWYYVKEELQRIGKWKKMFDPTSYPKLAFFTYKKIYKFEPIECSREFYEILAGYAGYNKVGDFEAYCKRIEEQNRKGMENDGEERIVVDKIYVSNPIEEEDARNKIESDPNFVKWMEW